MNKEEMAAYNNLDELKKANEKNNIYIYDCMICNKFIMLHHDKCKHCGIEN